MQGGLYTQDFLERGICEEAAWKALTDADVTATRAQLAALFKKFTAGHKPNEGVTEKDLIYPVLAVLSWSDVLVQQQVSARRRDDVPDALLFADADHKAAAGKEKEPANRYRHGLAVVEAKRWLRALDRADSQGTPSSQMLRYLRRAEESSDGKLEWGILTNGRQWRLYWQGARSRAEEFLELDLPAILGVPGFSLDLFAAGVGADHWLRVFILMFRRASFLPAGSARQSFHVEALRQTRKWEAKVAEGLSEQVFGEVFPALVKALAKSASDEAGKRPLTDAELESVRRAALTLLYRLLFVLYAEDRRLLPTAHDGYKAYSLDRLRDEIAERLDRNEVLSDRIDTRYGNLRALFGAIDTGDPKLGLPPYNGGLFDPAEHVLLDRAHLPDSVVALVVDTLSRRTEGERKLRINYRDLSVQQLGSIYERLLEYTVVADSEDLAAIRPNIFARKGSGSYYTPEELVRLIVDRTVGPLLDERQAAFDGALTKLGSESRPKADRVAELRAFDPAAAFLALRVCDPAMGSGHFLVTLVDVLADRTLAAMADAELRAGGVFGAEEGYRSPLQERIEGIRARISERAEQEGWQVADGQLDDRHIVRRMILKRVVYGVDKNPMAVELAKVSLWLHTFTVGAPLSFLDHHLRCGDSLFGEMVRPVEDILAARGSLALAAPLKAAKGSARAMAEIEDMSDADLAEVSQSEKSFGDVARATAPLTAFLDFFHGVRWLDRLPKKAKKSGRGMASAAAGDPVVNILDGALGDPVQVAAGRGSAVLTAKPTTGQLFGGGKPVQTELAHPTINAERHAEALDVLVKAQAVATRERFLHWQVAFPGVWEDWESKEPKGGFDAVIGNPPWDFMAVMDVEWFAMRRPEFAKVQRAADREKMIRALKKESDPLYVQYEQALEAAESAIRVARSAGYYPKLSTRRMNIYSLFVERAQALVKRNGIVGLLVPSGIAADYGASDFFGEIATSSRLAALLDFENRRSRNSDLEPFFADVDSRFKFCVFVFGGSARTFREAICGFFLSSAEAVSDPGRSFALTAKDFSRVNPNTKTAPIFRSRRDADIVRGIYERLPVLHDHTLGKRVWPVVSRQMLNMTTDSGRFRMRKELEGEGFYPVESGRLRKGSKEYLPLYEGKMVQAFDHRAANIVINTENLSRPAGSVAASTSQSENPNWYPNPQFYVSEGDVEWPKGLRWLVGFKDVTSPTNMRTMIASVIPVCGAGNTIPLIIPENERGADSYIKYASLWVANLNSIALDFVARQKVQGQHLNWFIVEQLPVIPTAGYQSKIGNSSVADLVREEVLHLTYTAHDMRPFAEDLDFDGAPFRWDDEDRRHRRARLDAIYFRLYGIGEDDAGYILDTFPIIREQDEKAFGKYRTKEMVLAYMRAFAAGDSKSRVRV